MDATFFIDESGNTGTDWLNADQPFFIYGGWLVPNENIENLNRYLTGFIDKEQCGELKSNKILKRNNGLKIFEEIFNSLLNEFSALPIFSIVDKEFMVAAKIVETFFDYDYNPNVNEYLTHPVELKKALANCILTSKGILVKFSELIKKGTIDVEKLRDVSLDLVKLFENEGHEQVAGVLRNLSDENLLSMIDEFEIVTDSGKMKNRITLTQTVLLEMIKNVEIISNNRGVKVNIIHDKLRGYSEVFKEIEANFFKEEQPYIYQNKDKIWLSRFPHVKTIIEDDSKNVPAIQGADMLCGFISKSFQTINSMGNLNKIEKGILKKLVVLRDEFINEMALIWNWYAPYNFERKFILSNNPKAKVYVSDYNNIIQSEFINAVSR